VYGPSALPYPQNGEKRKMNVILYIDNLATYITEEELKTLFIQVGEAIASGINKDRINRKSHEKKHRFPTAGVLGEIDREIGRFTASSFNESVVRVRMTIPKEQRELPSQTFEP
jgi:hypothetical protein